MRIAVDQHRTGAASALAATELGSHIADELAQGGKQINAAIDEDRSVATIVTKLQGGLGHRFCLALAYCWPVSRRRRCTPTTSRRYQALASESSTGEVPSVTAATAAAILAASSARPSIARSAALARTGVAAIAPSAMRAPTVRPPLIGRCAASVTTAPPFGLTRAILRYRNASASDGRRKETASTSPPCRRAPPARNSSIATA